MDRKIKTRQVHKDIKVLDKTVTVTDHIKQSYVRTKENIMQKVPLRLLGKRSRLQNKQQGPVSKHRSRQQMLLSRQCIIP